MLDGVPYDVASEAVRVPPAEQNLRLLVRVVRQVPREDVLGELSRLHEPVKERGHTFLGELRVCHAYQSVELTIEDAMLNHHAESPIWNDQLVVHVVGGAHHDLVRDKVASDLAASETDFHPVLLVALGLLERFRNLRVERADLVSLLHRLRTLFGENPRICTACVEERTHFLRLSGAYVQLTYV